MPFPCTEAVNLQSQGCFCLGGFCTVCFFLFGAQMCKTYSPNQVLRDQGMGREEWECHQVGCDNCTSSRRYFNACMDMGSTKQHAGPFQPGVGQQGGCYGIMILHFLWSPLTLRLRDGDMSHNLNSAEGNKGCYLREYIGNGYRGTKGDTRSLDYVWLIWRHVKCYAFGEGIP